MRLEEWNSSASQCCSIDQVIHTGPKLRTIRDLATNPTVTVLSTSFAHQDHDSCHHLSQLVISGRSSSFYSCSSCKLVFSSSMKGVSRYIPVSKLSKEYSGAFLPSFWGKYSEVKS